MTINHQTFTIICVDQITVQVYATFKNLEIVPFPLLLAIWRLFYAYINCPSYPLILMQSRINQIMTNIRKIFSSILLLLWSPRPSPPRHQANQQTNQKKYLWIENTHPLPPLCIGMCGMEDNLVFVNSQNYKITKDNKKR